MPPTSFSAHKQRNHRPSKCALRGQGLPTDSESNDSENEGGGSDKYASDGELAPSESISQVASQVTSQAASTTPSQPPASHASGALKASKSRRENFDEHYKTATRTKEDILGMFYISWLPISFTHESSAAQMALWTADCYSHYKMPPAIVDDGDKIRYVFVCKW